MKFLVIVTPGWEEGNYVVECPTIHGCISQGKTVDEALANIKDAISGCLEVMEKEGFPLITEDAIQFHHVEVER